MPKFCLCLVIALLITPSPNAAPQTPINSFILPPTAKVLPPDRAFCVWGNVSDDYIAAFDPRSLYIDRKFEPLAVRWTQTATDGAGLADGDPITLTYSFVPDGAVVPGDPDIGNGDQPSDLFAAFDGIYGSTAAWQAEFHQVFARWGELTGITYVFEPNDDGAAFAQFGTTEGAPGQLGVRGDIRIAGYSVDGSGSGGLAFSFFPNSGELILDTDNAVDFYADTSNDSLNLRNIVAHEHGHGLGMRHVCPRNDTKLMEPNLTDLFDGPQIDDILLAQKHYGDRYAGNQSRFAAAGLGNVDNATLSETMLSLPNASQADFFSIAVSSTHVISATVTPIGGSYLSGPQNPNGTCSAGALFDANAQLDLSISILDASGAVVAAKNIQPAGATEAISEKVAPGTYFIRVFATSGADVQGYNLEVSGTPAVGPILRNESGGGIIPFELGERTLSVEVLNTIPPVSMQWFKNDEALVNGGSISGATTSMLTISPVAVDDTGEYVLHVTDGTMETVESDPILLFVVENLPLARPMALVTAVCALLVAGASIYVRNPKLEGLNRFKNTQSNYYNSRN